MRSYLYSATDIRQSKPWGNYMKNIGWEVLDVDGKLIYIKKIKLINRSVIKVQHPKGKLNFKKIEKEIKKFKPLFIFIEPHQYNFDERDYLKHGYKKSRRSFAPSSTIKIDLTKTEEEIFKSFSDNAKRNIKKAEKQNIELKVIEIDKDLNGFEDYYLLLKSLRKQKKFYAPGYEESLIKMKSFKNNSVLLFAYKDKKPVAVVWLGYFDKVATYLQTGNAQEGYRALANYLLVWQGIKWAKKNGIKVFDFESIFDPRNPHENKRWKGFTEFKKRFHGEIINYPPVYVKYYSFLFKFLEIFPR